MRGAGLFCSVVWDAILLDLPMWLAGLLEKENEDNTSNTEALNKFGAEFSTSCNFLLKPEDIIFLE